MADQGTFCRSIRTSKEEIRCCVSCYNCKHRGPVVGSCHSECNHPTLGDGLVKAILVLDSKLLNGIVDMDPHGVKMGWCNYPIDFDPTWIKQCKLFEEKK